MENTELLIIEQKLNKLFYAKQDLDNELKFLKIKRGAQKERVGLHASNIIANDVEFCYRQQVLSLFYEQLQGEQLPVRLKRIFVEGDAIHEKWQRLFIRGGLGNPSEMDKQLFKNEYDLYYSPDAVVQIAGKRYMVEIKSMNTIQFKKAISHPAGERQLLFYMWLTGMKDGFVLVEDKNTQEFKIFKVDYDLDRIEKYIERLEKIMELKQKFVEKKKPPKRKCKTSETKLALKCNMREVCWNIGKGRVKLKGV